MPRGTVRNGNGAGSGEAQTNLQGAAAFVAVSGCEFLVYQYLGSRFYASDLPLSVLYALEFGYHALVFLVLLLFVRDMALLVSLLLTEVRPPHGHLRTGLSARAFPSPRTRSAGDSLSWPSCSGARGTGSPSASRPL